MYSNQGFSPLVPCTPSVFFISRRLLCFYLERGAFVARFFFCEMWSWLRKGGRFILAFFWVTGLLCGIFAFRRVGSDLVPLMRRAAYAPVSIVGILCAATLPFLLSAFAVFLSRPVWILPICFGKAFCFSLISMGILQAYGSAGWLIRYLLLFGNCASAPILYWLWLQYFRKYRSTPLWEGTLAFSLALLLGSINYRVIAPLLASLIEYTKG